MRRYSQLIQTKLCIPRLRSRTVNRGRLVEKATAEPGIVLTLVSAPPGYGKTTLLVELSHALAQSGAAIVWYALDSTDNDQNLFGSYLVEGLGEAMQINTDLAHVARSLRSYTEINLETVLPTIINAVVSKQQTCILVLDDYHFITSPAIHNGLTFLLDHLPENMHIVIGTRSDPPLPLARFRARSKITEIRTADLRFSQDETRQFLNETMCLDLPSEAITEIEASTEGWITGLQLAALSMAGQSDSAGFISRFGGSNRYLVEYLLQEVVERQSAEIRRFLLSTSVLERLCGPLCDAVQGGQPGSEVILHQLEQTNLFIISLDDEGYWYRYHHLFRDFLRARLKQNEPNQVSLLHRAASEWYTSQNLLSEAVSHAIASKDWAYAADIVEKHGMTMFNRSELSILRRWCEGFPEPIFHTHPMLCILQGWALSLSYRKENRRLVEQRMQQAEIAAGQHENKQLGERLIAQAALVRLSLCLIPDPAVNPEQVIDFAQSILDMLPGDDSGRGIATSAIGYAYLSQQNLPMAMKTIKEFRRLSLSGGFYYGVAAATFYMANLAYCQGQFEHAKEMCQQVQRSMAGLFTDPGQDLPAIGSLDISLGCVLLEENRLDEAEQALLHGLEIASGTNNPFYRMVACVALFRLREIQHRETEAFRYLDDIENTWPDIVFYTQGLRLMHLIRTDPLSFQTQVIAADWCQEFSQYISENMFLPGIGPFGGSEAYYQASLIWVRAQILLGKAGETLPYLKRQMDIAESQGLIYRFIELSLAEAQARKILGEDQRVSRLLDHTLKLAKSAGCIRVFDQGPALTRLLREATRQDFARDYVEQILAIIGTSDQRGVSFFSGTGVKDSQERLSERELEVLHLMASGASNKQMADQLVITVGTIKSHINHILSKLDAHNRLEAVAQARERGLIKN